MEKGMSFDLPLFTALAVFVMLSVVGVGMLREAPIYRIEYRGFSFAELYPIDASFLLFLMWSLFLVGVFMVCLAYSDDLGATEPKLKLARRVFAKVAVSTLAAMLVAAYLADHIYQIQFFNSLPFYGLLGVYGIIAFGIYMCYKYLLDVARGRWS
jgi:hypothetical protein